MKKLSPHEKINLRAWMARCTTGAVPQDIRAGLPLREVIRMSYAITGRPAAVLAGEQPSLVRTSPRAIRPSDKTRYERRREFGKKAA